MVRQSIRSISWFRVARAILPVLKTAAEGILAAKAVDTDGGRKITRTEWENILYELFVEAIPQLAVEMEKEGI